MGKVERLHPEPELSTILRENLAGLVEALRKAEQVKRNAELELAEANLKKSETAGNLREAEKRLNVVLKFYDDQAKAPAEKAKGFQVRSELQQSMGGTSWNFHGARLDDGRVINFDPENFDPSNPSGFKAPDPEPTPEEIAAMPPVEALRDAARMALNEDYSASIRIGVLEGIKTEAERVLKRAEDAVDEAVKAILRAEIAPVLLQKGSTLYEEFVPTIIALNQLSVLLEDRFGRPDPVRQQIVAFISNLFGGNAFRNWENHKAALVLREKVEQLLTNPNAELPQ